jgi:hypothetical protein
MAHLPDNVIKVLEGGHFAYSGQFVHRFRRNPFSDSDSIRSPIPVIPFT